MKKTWTMMLALMLSLMMLLSACSGGSKEESSKDTSAATSETTEDSASESQSADDAFAEHYKISYVFMASDSVDYNAGSDFHKWFADKFNFEWEPVPITWDSWNERMNTWINSDDLSDMNSWLFSGADAIDYVNQDLFKKLPDDWRERYPNLAKACAYSPAQEYYDNLFGGTYCLFTPVFGDNFPADVITSHLSLFVRKDYAEQAGYDLSANIASHTITLSELTAYLTAVKEAGICEYPLYLSQSGIGYYIHSVADNAGGIINCYYKGADGQYHWGPAEDETNVKNAIHEIRDQYEAGLIYPEFYTLNTDEDRNEFLDTGKAAAVVSSCMANSSDQYQSEFEENQGGNYYDAVEALVLTDDNGIAYDSVSTNFFGAKIFSPYIDDGKLERILAIMDYLCTEEGNLTGNMGIKGIDWDYDSEGNVVNLLDGTAENKYGTIAPYQTMAFNMDDFNFISPAFSEASRNTAAELYIARAGVTSVRGKDVDWDLNGFSSPSMSQASLIYNDEYVNLIISDGDFDTNYDNWVESKMSLIQPVLDELNSAFGE